MAIYRGTGATGSGEPISLVDADNAAITGGTIDGVTIATSDITVGAGKTLDVSNGTLTLANDQISGDKIDGGTISNFASTGIDDNATSTAITIDSSENIGIGTTVPSTLLHLQRNSSNDQLTLQRTGTATGKWNIYTHTNGLHFYDTVGATERLTIDSSGYVGVGMAYPNVNLHVNDASTVAKLRLTNATTGSGSTDGYELSMNGVDLYHVNREAGSMMFYTSALERLRINSSGNVGIGNSSPSSWQAAATALQISNTMSLFSITGVEACVAENAYNDGGWKYQTTSEASMHGLWSGLHVFRVAASGTAGNSITWTDALAIANDGNATFYSSGNTTTKVTSGAGKYAALHVESGSGSSPYLFFNIAGAHHGRIYGNSSDQLTFAVGGSVHVAARFDFPATAGQTGFMLYDVDNATVERVTVGAADSGGAGYKVLRIPN